MFTPATSDSSCAGTKTIRIECKGSAHHRWGTFRFVSFPPRETSPSSAAMSEEKRLFSQARTRGLEFNAFNPLGQPLRYIFFSFYFVANSIKTCEL